MEKSDQGQCCKKNLEQMNVREKMSAETGMHQWHKEPRPRGAAMSKKHEDIWNDLQEGSHAGDHVKS
jgi:hypothetical protein